MGISTTLVGIANITPDSFSDGGKYIGSEQASAHIAMMIAQGAAVVDIGAESTRPGAMPVLPEEEWRRLEPVLPRAIAQCHAAGVEVSVDTRHAATSRRALALGVDWINDVSGFMDRGIIDTIMGYNNKLVIMHSLSVPVDPKQVLAEELDVVVEISAFFKRRIAKLERAGIARSRMILDPGIGFGKTAAQSLSLLERIEEFRAFGLPLLVGHSRKSFLRQLGEDRDRATLEVSRRLIGKVEYLRVHDVAAHAGLLKEMEHG